jgi:hypothetical protein
MLKETTASEAARVDYVAQDGEHIDSLSRLGTDLDDLAWDLEEEAQDLRGKGREALLDSAKAIRGLVPDEEAMPPEPDPVEEAQRLLWEETQRAQELLRAESARQAKENTIKEAFAIPNGLLSAVFDVLRPEIGTDEYRELFEKVSAVFEDAGWKVYKWTGRLESNDRGEPLRQLSTLMEKYPVHHLTAHVRAVLHHALRWCENTSCNHPSPISGKVQNGNAPEGVLYPRISIELVPAQRSRDVPKEWQEPLVNVEVKS